MRAMKDSGIDWIGDIPRIWKVVPLRSQYLFGKGLSITKADLTDSGAAVISYGQIHSKDNIGVSVQDSLIRYISWDNVSLSDSSKTSIGDIIFADTSEDLEGCGNCVYVDRTLPIYAGYHTIILRPKTSDLGRYYAYLFASDAWRAQIRATVSGVKVFSVTQNVLKTTKLLIPPVEEQKRIVSFLDKKCAEIDALITEKETTNTLLKELRLSIIYEAVTKGLDPTAPMKDSGVEWVGKIPQEWDLRRLKTNFDIVTGATPKSGEASYWDGAIPWITPADYKTEDVYVSVGRKSITQEGMNSCATSLVPEGSIVFSKRAPIGLVAISSNPLCTNQGCLSCIPKESVDVKYYYYVMSIYSEQFDLFASGTTFKEISTVSFANFKLPYPNFEIQRRIASYLDTKCSEIDALIAANKETIALLKELRQSIIYETVTGKIEV